VCKALQSDKATLQLLSPVPFWAESHRPPSQDEQTPNQAASCKESAPCPERPALTKDVARAAGKKGS
jgi:hypothetical protein